MVGPSFLHNKISALMLCNIWLIRNHGDELYLGVEVPLSIHVVFPNTLFLPDHRTSCTPVRLCYPSYCAGSCYLARRSILCFFPWRLNRHSGYCRLGTGCAQEAGQVFL